MIVGRLRCGQQLVRTHSCWARGCVADHLKCRQSDSTWLQVTARRWGCKPTGVLARRDAARQCERGLSGVSLLGKKSLNLRVYFVPGLSGDRLRILRDAGTARMRVETFSERCGSGFSRAVAKRRDRRFEWSLTFWVQVLIEHGQNQLGHTLRHRPITVSSPHRYCQSLWLTLAFRVSSFTLFQVLIGTAKTRKPLTARHRS